MRVREIALICAAFAIDCNSKSDAQKKAPELAASNVAAALGIDADLPPPPDPTPPAGALASDVASFTTLDACVATHAKLDPLVGDALLSFGYDTFLRDACRQLDAVKARDAKKCDAVVASELRTHCRSTVAMVTSAPDECPFPESADMGGRDATCIAVASHDARLCAAADGSDRPTCEAIALRDSSKCDGLPTTDRASCKRIADRLESSIDPPHSDLAALPPMIGKLEVHAQAGTQAVVPDTSDLHDAVASGVVIVTSSIETRFSFGQTPTSSAYPHSVSPESKLGVGFEIDVTNTPAHDARLHLLALEIPGGVRLDSAQVHGVPKVKIVQLSKERLGAIEFTIDAEAGASPQGYAFHVEVKSFIADVVPARLAK
ncbi:MAG: hypothetical protein ACRELY_15505 [Polyangiaceae bacterium]